MVKVVVEGFEVLKEGDYGMKRNKTENPFSLQAIYNTEDPMGF